MAEVLGLEVIADIVTSKAFKDFFGSLRKKVKKTEEMGEPTIDELARMQAEGLTFERIYMNLLSSKITRRQAVNLIEALGEKVNPNPFEWLKKKLVSVRQWIVDSIKVLRKLGNELGLKISQIEVELGITPRVKIIYTL